MIFADWIDEDEAKEDEALWNDDWDDEELDDEFSKQLRSIGPAFARSNSF